jgi:hypothetical protein
MAHAAINTGFDELFPLFLAYLSLVAFVSGELV